MDLAHGPHGSFEGSDDPVDGVLGADEAFRELGQAGGLGHGGTAAIGQGMKGAHPLGRLVGKLPGGIHDFVQLQVQVPEVGSHDVPVGLLALDVQLNQVREYGLQVVGQGR